MISKHVHYEAAHDNYGTLARYIADAGHEGEKCLVSWCRAAPFLFDTSSSIGGRLS